MEMTGSETIPAPPERVFEALNDADVLLQCIPGCQSLERLTDNEMAATVVVKIGAMPAKFNCTVKISDPVYPESYKITGEGKAGAAGAARGEAEVKLSPDPGGTLLRYEVKTELEGMLSKLGTGLLDQIAKDISVQFFENLGTRIASTGNSKAQSPSQPASTAANIKLPSWIWAVVAAIAALLLVLLLR